MALITFPWLVDGEPENATSVELSDPTGSFGIRRSDTNEILVAAGEPLDNMGEGLYSYTLVEPVNGLTYEYWIKAVYDNETYHVEYSITGGGDIKTLRFVLIDAGDVVTPDSVPSLSNPAGSYGIARVDTGEAVVADGTAMTANGTLFALTFNEPGEGLTYRYYVEVIYDGVTYHLPRTTAYMASAALVIGRYTNSQMIEQQFGVENVHKWLGIDDTDEAVDWALRMYRFIELVESELDAMLRGGRYSVPFTAPVPGTIRGIATSLAAVRIYESRGVVDMNAETGAAQHRLHYQKKDAERKIAAIKLGQLRLDLESTTRVPVVVEDAS